MGDLGLIEDYGHWIISGFLVFYGVVYTYLAKEYGHIDKI